MTFNRQWFYEEALLHMLYMYDIVSTQELEEFFNKDHYQRINNIISNRHESTNYIFRGYMEYNKDRREISITEKGRMFIKKI